MVSETIYNAGDLIYGVCERCGEESNEIDPNTGWCIDCIEEEKFYRESMKYSEKSFKNW